MSPEEKRQATEEVTVQSDTQDKPADDEAIVIVDQLLGKTLDDRYLIIRPVGSGGMSTVYQATDLSLKRTVAIKILPAGHRTDSRSMARFEQGAKAASRLDHANIAKVYECGIYNLNQPYIVMEFIVGHSLDEVLKEKKTLSIARTVNLVMQVCDALDHAHQRRVIHRDLKTSNIMTIGNGDEYQVKIVDFGIAKIVQEGSGQQLTNTGEVFGSPLYMSPEQCAGLSVDKRTDIYSLGCVLYECLAGLPPHIGTSPLATLMKHQQELPLSLKEATLGGNFPPELEAIVAKMLAKRPDDRYRNVMELKEVLKDFIAGKASAEVDLNKELPPGEDFFRDVGVSRQHNFQKIDLTMLKSSEPRFTRKSMPLYVFMALSLVAIAAVLYSVFFGNQTPAPKPAHEERKELITPADAARILKNANAKAWTPEDNNNTDNFRMEFYARHPDRTSLNCLGYKADAQHWSLLKDFKQLRNLNLSQSNISNADFGNLIDLPLMKLDLGNLTGDDKSSFRKLTAADLTPVLNLKSLISLNLRQNDVDQSVLDRLNPTLRELDLSECPHLSDQSVTKVAALPNLRRLDLKGNHLTEEALKTLANHKTFEYIDLSNCSLLEQSAIDRLHKALPDCLIESSY